MYTKTTNNTWLRAATVGLAMLVAATMLQAANFTYNGINYSTVGSTTNVNVAKYTVSSSDSTQMYKGDLVIPETFEYEGKTYTVVGTAANAFKDCVELTSLVLPNTCVTIARNTFNGCTGLTVSPIPLTVTSVGNGVFSGCSSITEVTVTSGWGRTVSEQFSGCPLKKMIFAGTAPVEINLDAFGKTTDTRLALTTLEEIEFGCDINSSSYANNMQPFHNMTGLKKITFGGSATTLSSTMFQGCTALTDVIFAEDNAVTSIGVSAFQGCTSLSSIALPAGVTSIEISTFYGCSSLAQATLGPNVSSIGTSAFYGTGLEGIELPESLTTIGVSAFQKSKLSGNLTVPSGVTSIGSQAFAETQLNSISLPAGVNSIGNAAFAPIATLADIALDGGNTAFALTDGFLTSADGVRLLVSAHQNASAPTTWDNATVQTVDNYGLAHSPLKTITLPALTQLGNFAFYKSQLESFTLASNVSVGQNVFSNSALQSLIIADGRNEIPQGLCDGCAELSEVTLPSTATNMMLNAFANCPKLVTMEIPANVNYMEPGSVPSTIQALRVLNLNTPVLAAGMFTADQSEVECKVAVSSVDEYKAAAQWQYLNIVGDATIQGDANASLGCPTGLYFATKDGRLMYRDENGEVIDTEFRTGDHAFNLASYKNRIYVGSAGRNFRYEDAAAQANGGDGEVFYVNNTNGIFYRVTVLNNVGYKAFEDPFSLSILADENKVVIADRNVGIHEMNADTVGLYGSQPFLVENNQLPYYNRGTAGMMYGGIGCGFDKVGDIYWMGKKFNGYGIFRFRKSDIYDSETAKTKDDPFKVILPYIQMTQFYVDKKNDYIYFYLQSSSQAGQSYVPGVYRLPMSAVTAADAEGVEVGMEQATLIDDSPVLLEGGGDEITGITQFTSDGEHVYWAYIASPSNDRSVPGSVDVDPSNPLHQSGIKCITAKPASDTEKSEVTFAVEGVEAYGVAGATFVGPEPQYPIGDVTGDGSVDIADVSAAINIMLGTKQIGDYPGNADINKSGSIDITDVNGIVNMMLGRR